MGNLFFNLPIPAANGVGVGVDVSALGALKNILISGNAVGFITIEMNNDPAQAGSWAEIATVENRDIVPPLQLAAKWMRARMSGYKSGVAQVNVGGTDGGSQIANLPVTPGDGAGPAVSTTALGTYKSITVGDKFTGVVNIQVSEDGISDWGDVMSFSQPGVQSALIAAEFMRAKRSGSKGGATPVVNVGGTNDMGTGNDEIPTPPFEIEQITIYARTSGSDETGNGKTIATAYRTFQRAVRDVPPIGSPGAFYDVDITGISEALPIGYILPSWKMPQTFQVNFGQFGPIFPIKFAVNIVADPEPVPLIPASDAFLNLAGDFVVSTDPITGLVTLTLTGPARPSWGGNALAGKQLIGTGGAGDSCEIYESDTTFIRIAHVDTVFDPAPTAPLQIVQPSATLTSVDDSFGFVIQVLNCDSVGFAGIRISTGPFAFAGLFIDGNGNAGASLCELDSPAFVNVASDMARVAKCWVKGFPFFAATGSGMFFSGSFMDKIVTSFPFIGLSTPVAHFENMVYDGCDPIEPVFAIDTFQPAVVENFSMTNTLVRNGGGDGIIFHGGYGQLNDCDISGNAGNGITVDKGAGRLRLENVGSSVANLGDFGVDVTDGMQVSVDVATSTTQPGAARPLTGTTGAPSTDTSIGSVGGTSWAAVAGALNIPDYTGPAATGSRLLQE